MFRRSLMSLMGALAVSIGGTIDMTAGAMSLLNSSINHADLFGPHGSSHNRRRGTHGSTRLRAFKKAREKARSR